MKNAKMLNLVVGVWAVMMGAGVKADEPQLKDEKSKTLDAPALEVIEVTAQKRTQSIQEVPMSVQALTGDVIERSGVSDFEDIVHISPSISLQDNLSPFQKSIYIRGTGTTINSATVESSVSTVVDGVVLARQGQFFGSLADTERVEVLRGPQSTLFGKNASAGVLNIVTEKPSFEEQAMRASVSYDEYGEWNAKGTVTGPISDEVAFRLSGNYKYVATSHIENVNNDGPSLDKERAKGARGKLQWDINDNIELMLIADYSDTSAPSGVRVFRSVSEASLEASNIDSRTPVIPGESNRQVNINDPHHYDMKDWGGSAELNWWLDDHQITSITAYRNWQMDDALDIDSTGVDIPVSAYIGYGTPSFRGVVNSTKDTEQMSQEVRLQSTHEGAFQYTIGAYLWGTNYIGINQERRTVCYDLVAARPVYSNCEGVPPPAAYVASQSYDQLTDVSTQYYALFGQFDYELSQKLSVSLGLRSQRDVFEWDVQQRGIVEEGDLPEPRYEGAGKQHYTETTGKLSFQYALESGANAYATYSKGYKGPGADFALPDSAPLEPEYVDAYEIGYKTQWFNRRLNLTSALFWQDFENTQVSYFDETDVIFRPTNAGKTRQRGLEIDGMFAATNNLTLTLATTWLDAEFQSYSVACYVNDPSPSCSESGTKDVSGETTTFSPEFKIVSGLHYESDALSNGATWFLQANHRWQSEVQYDASQNPATIQGAYGIADVFIGYTAASQRYSVSLFVKNIFDTQYVNNLAAFVDSTGQGESVIQFVPKTADRLIGVSVNFQY
ncbi:TonB-dependent receptor [Alteromonas sp. HB246098]